MLFLAALLVGSYIVGQERQATEIGAKAAHETERHPVAVPARSKSDF